LTDPIRQWWRGAPAAWYVKLATLQGVTHRAHRDYRGVNSRNGRNVGQSGQAAKLAALAVAGQVITYMLTMVLARRLGVGGFEAYAVASAAFILMVTFVPRGVEKYALRILPALLARAEWGLARGFLRYGLSRTLQTSLLIGSAVAAWAWWSRDFSDAIRIAIVVSCLALPAGALVHHGVEVLSALGREVQALTLFRIVVPLITFGLVGVLLALPSGLSGPMAIGCWGVAWAVALAMMAFAIRRAAPQEISGAVAIEDSRWTQGARPFFIYRISLGLLGQAGVIALDVLQPSAESVGAYAAAMGTAGLVAVLATATNRAYARRLSILLEQRDFATVLDLRSERVRWMLPTVAVLLTIAFVFTRELLRFFRPEFVDRGIVPLRILAVTTAFSVLFALAPTYLKFRQRNRATYTTVACAAAVQGLLLLLLIPRLGATGAAIAYAVSMCGMYGTYAWMGHRELTLLNARDHHA
jgi:O-antigen/teichoic acid export membrane protein